MQQPNWQRHYLAPSCRTAAAGESEAHRGSWAPCSWSGGQTSFLYRKLVIEEKARCFDAGPTIRATALDQSRIDLQHHARRPAFHARNAGQGIRTARSPSFLAVRDCRARARSSAPRPGSSPTRPTPATASRIWRAGTASSLALGQTRERSRRVAREDRCGRCGSGALTSHDATLTANPLLPDTSCPARPTRTFKPPDLRCDSATRSVRQNQRSHPETPMLKHIARLRHRTAAVNVKTVMTPRGLTLWLVESTAVPLVSLEFAVRRRLLPGPCRTRRGSA